MPRRVLVVTGARSEFGLLRPVLRAIDAHPRLHLLVAAAGEHFLPPAQTWREVAAEFRIDARVRMQSARGPDTRLAHAAALARGVTGFAHALAKLRPDWVVVLGDRIEAFAAASAASIAGMAVCHIHGGDRAEGIADESMRHATTKLAHLHCPATAQSADRIRKLGEPDDRIHITGSPAIDDLRRIKPLSDREAVALGDPRVIVLLHPAADGADNARVADALASAAAELPDEPALGPCTNRGVGPRCLLLHPNHDPGRDDILSRWQHISRRNGWPIVPHLPRDTFLGLLKRMATRRRGVIIGNSSAALIECAALGVPALNVGPRQAGRERDRNVIDAEDLTDAALATLPRLLRRADGLARRLKPSTRFGDGQAGPAIADLLARVDTATPGFTRKRNTY